MHFIFIGWCAERDDDLHLSSGIIVLLCPFIAFKIMCVPTYVAELMHLSQSFLLKRTLKEIFRENPLENSFLLIFLMWMVAHSC